MTCVNCHNPHTDDIKQEHVGDLCQSCHTQEGYFYNMNMTSHAEADLLCTDCHLRISDVPMGEGHAQRNHTFMVDLQTCNGCHLEEMHKPAPKDEAAGVVQPDHPDGGAAMSLLTASYFTDLSPSPASPFNFVLLAALIGLAFGFVGSPLFERWFRLARREI